MSDNQKNNEVLTPEDVKELAPLYDAVVLALKQVYDPEIPVDVYELGLIYDIKIEGSKVSVTMTLTAPRPHCGPAPPPRRRSGSWAR